MSTFLELCQDFRREAGISGTDTDPASVTGQTGELAAVVRWVQRGYREIQRKWPHWRFLQKDFSFQTIIGTTNYVASAIDAEHKSWIENTFRCYRTSLGTVDERHLTPVAWEVFRDRFLFGANRDVTGPPQYFAVKPDESIELWPKPDAIYTIAGEHRWRVQVMVNNADEPIFGRDFHEAIMWHGMMLYAAFEGAPELYAHAQNEYNRTMARLEIDQLPPMTTAGPLA